MTDPTITYDVLEKRFETAPEKPAIMEGDLALTNRDVFDRVEAIARFLIAKGVTHGDRVATLAPPSCDFWLIFLATTSIGAIWQGLNPAYKASEYEYLLGDAQPRVIFARASWDGRAYADELADLADAETVIVPLTEAPLASDDERLLAGESVAIEALENARAHVSPEDIAVIVYTSGTTGQPKGAMLSHRAVVQTALSNLLWMPPEGVEKTVCPAPINHVGGLNNVCFTVFAAGGTIIFFPRVDIAKLGEVNLNERPTYLVGSPTAWAMMIAAGADFAMFDFYKLIVFGGAASSVEQLREVQKANARMSSVYGQTETTGMMTYNDADASLEIMAETIGKPIAGNEIRIAHEDGTPAQLGDTAEIQVRGVSVMSGYWNKPEASAAAFTQDGWLKTGDLGYEREDQNIVFAGRLKEMFKSGGYNVYPVEVELAIGQHPAVAEVAVVEVSHPTFQEVGHAFLTCRPGMETDGDKLKAYLSERIANYKIPKSWQFLDAFPRLPNGKTDKRALRGMIKA